MNDSGPLARAGAMAEALGRYYTATVLCLAALSIAVIAIIMGLQVFFRYVLNDSLIWAEEVCRHGLIWTSFLFAGIAFQRGEMVAITFARNALPEELRLLCVAVGYGATLVLLWVLAYYGYVYASRSAHQTIPAARFILEALLGAEARPRVSIFWVYIAVPVGLGLLSLHVLVAMIRQIAEARDARRVEA